MHCSVIGHVMTSLSFQTAIQKNEGKLSSFAQFESELASYLVTEQSTPSYVLTVLERSHIQNDVIACTVV